MNKNQIVIDFGLETYYKGSGSNYSIRYVLNKEKGLLKGQLFESWKEPLEVTLRELSKEDEARAFVEYSEKLESRIGRLLQKGQDIHRPSQDVFESIAKVESQLSVSQDELRKIRQQLSPTTQKSLTTLSEGQSGTNALLEIIETTPVLPAELDLGEKLFVKFRYHLGSAESVQIWARPYTNGKRTPGYSAHGSRGYRKKDKDSGENEGWFSFRKPTVVDEIRIDMHETASNEKICTVSKKVDARWTGTVSAQDSSIKQRPVKTSMGPFAVGKPFPELEFTSLRGKTINLKQFKGKVLLVDFWATWCGPCVSQMPDLITVYENLKAKGFEIIGISLDKDRGRLESFLEDRHITWPQYYDGKGWGNEIASRFDIHAVPTTVLIDQNGIIRHINVHAKELEEAVKTLLAEDMTGSPQDGL